MPLVPTLYLAAFVWETRLVLQPSVTPQLLFGATLVVLMAPVHRACSARRASRPSDGSLLELKGSASRSGA